VSRVALLDVNVLVALFHPDHIHHEAAHTWLAANRFDGWATCPLTENGLLRILSNAASSGMHENAASIRLRLETFCSSGSHVFWPDSVSLRDERRFRLVGATHKQVTDIYLLGLSVENGGRLATFDRRIPLRAVIDAGQDALAVIAG
jgi:toxin-antitoxin system PIN domain toxin